MTNHEYATLLADTLSSSTLHRDELCFLHALHLRLIAQGEEAPVSGKERSRVLAIISAQRLSQELPELVG
jgi:hypothetical protein